MSEGTPPSESASVSTTPQQPAPTPAGKGKKNLWIMIAAIVVALILVSVALLAFDWGGDDGNGDDEPNGEAEMEIVLTMSPGTSVTVGAGETVMLSVSPIWKNVDTGDEESLIGVTGVLYSWTRWPITLGAFDLTGKRVVNFTAMEYAGTGKINCTVEYEDVTEMISASVTVEPAYLASVAVSPDSVRRGLTQPCDFTAEPYDSVGDLNTTDVTYSWSVVGLDSGDYTLSSTTSQTVTFTGLAMPDVGDTVYLNVSAMQDDITVYGESTITLQEEIVTFDRSLDYTWSEMFEIPCGDWYDLRDEEVVWTSDDEWVDWEGAPYIYSWWGLPTGNVWHYTIMQLDVEGVNMTELNMNSNPQFLPRLGTTGGGNAIIDWYLGYDIDLLAPYEDATNNNDGYVSIFTGTTILDEKAARSVLGMPADQWATFDTWWAANNMSTEYYAWLDYEGNTRLDIYASYEWSLQAFDWWLSAKKVGDTVVMEHLLTSWGMEALMARWTNESFMDDTEWWYHDFNLNVEITPEWANLTIDTNVEWGAYAYEGTVDAEPCWSWEALMNDYVTKGQHPSRYEIYENLEYENFAPGSTWYGDTMTYDYVPGAFNLSEDETLTFEWPSGDWAFLRHDEDAGDHMFVVEWAPITVMYMEPMGTDFPTQITIDNGTRTVTFEGPIDMWAWSKDQTIHEYLASEWVRLEVFPYGAPFVEFSMASTAMAASAPGVTADAMSVPASLGVEGSTVESSGSALGTTGSAASVSAASELMAVAVVVMATMLAVAALGCSARRLNRT